MSDQFICISCWKEFAANEEELANRGGKIVCPFCGYIQPAPSGASPSESVELESVGKLEAAPPPVPGVPPVAEEISWSSIGTTPSDDEDFPITEDDERTDRVEIPAELLSGGDNSFEVGMESEFADEKTPLEVVTSAARLDEVLDQSPGTNGVLVEDVQEEEEGDERGGLPEKLDWQLRTPSGLTFKFTDPEALLGWKKKLATYKSLDVSPDGQRWVDFARFVRQYEELGDALRSFLISENLSDADLPPPKPLPTDDDPEPMRPLSETTDGGGSADGSGRDDSENGRRATAQFTFKVKEEKNGGWGKYLFFALLGIGLGAGIVLAVLHFTGIFELPIPIPPL